MERAGQRTGFEETLMEETGAGPGQWRAEARGRWEMPDGSRRISGGDKQQERDRDANTGRVSTPRLPQCPPPTCF